MMDIIQRDICETLGTLLSSLLSYRNTIKSGIKSIKGFRKLKDVELDINLLRRKMAKSYGSFGGKAPEAT